MDGNSHAAPLPGSPLSLVPGGAAPQAGEWVTGTQRPNTHGFPCAARVAQQWRSVTQDRALALGGPPMWQIQFYWHPHPHWCERPRLLS